MSESNTVVMWRVHPATRKWHAWRADEECSVCRYTKVAEGETQAALPDVASRCRVCSSALRLPIREPPPGVVPPVPAYETMRAEFRGGPFDGETLMLKVIRTTATEHRVLAGTYSRSEAAPWRDPTAMAKD
jgi:hypothetical protein